MSEDHDLRAAIESRNINALWEALGKCSKRDGALFLAEALLEDWHESHEDIVFELGLIGDQRTTDAISAAALKEFQYLVVWDNLQEFQRKCAYALARIGSLESKTALEKLAQNPDPHISEYGKEGLEHWPMPFRKGEYA